MKIKPLADRIMIIPIDQNSEEVRASGLITVKKDIPPSTKGKVLALGATVSNEIKVGDLVQYGQHSGIPITWEDKDYLIMREKELICIL